MNLFDHPYQVKLRKFDAKHRRIAENGSRSFYDALCYDLDGSIFDICNRKLKRDFFRQLEDEQRQNH